MSCHTRCRPTMYATQVQWWHATSDVIPLCVLHKGDENMSRPMSSDRVCFPKEMMTCHARHCPTCVLPKGDDGMPCRTCFSHFVFYNGSDGMQHSTSSDSVCCPRTMMAFNARRHLTVCTAQGRWWLSIPDVVRSCGLSKENVCIPCSTSSYHAWYSSTMRSCHSWHSPTVCAAVTSRFIP